MSPSSRHPSPRDATLSRNDGAAALRALLQNEVHPLYACGRAYLSNLARWRDHLLSHQEGDSLSAEDQEVAAATTAAVASAGRRASMTPRGESKSSLSKLTSRAVSSAVSPGDYEANDYDPSLALCGNRQRLIPVDDHHARHPDHRKPVAARPDQYPTVLLQWRARVAEWFFDFAEHQRFEPNTVLAALSYLDAYSTSVCFPEEFARIMKEAVRESPNDEEDTSSSSPSPPKKRKTSQGHQRHEDYLWEYVENCRRQEREEEEGRLREEAVRGMGRDRYKLAALTSLYLACKIYQSCPLLLSTWDFSRACRKRFSAGQIEAMESSILGVLTFRVHPPTALRFVQEMLPLMMPRDDGDESFGALDSSPWVPRDDVQKMITADANFLAALASYGDAAKFPPVVSAPPSKIALAAIVESSNQIFFKGNSVRQHTLLERAMRLPGVPYDDEVMAIEGCLAELRRLNDRANDSSRETSPSPATVLAGSAPDDPVPVADASPYAAEDKRSLRAVPPPKKLDGQALLPRTAAPSRCAAASRPSAAASRLKPRKKPRHCPGGSNHRMWERADACASAAAATRRSYENFAIEMLGPRGP